MDPVPSSDRSRAARVESGTVESAPEKPYLGGLFDGPADAGWEKGVFWLGLAAAPPALGLAAWFLLGDAHHVFGMLALFLSAAAAFGLLATYGIRRSLLRLGAIDSELAGSRIPATFPTEGNWLRRVLEKDGIGFLALREDHLHLRFRTQFLYMYLMCMAILLGLLPVQFRVVGGSPPRWFFWQTPCAMAWIAAGNFLSLRLREFRVPWGDVLGARKDGLDLVLRVGHRGLPAELRIRPAGGAVLPWLLERFRRHLPAGSVEG